MTLEVRETKYPTREMMLRREKCQVPFIAKADFESFSVNPGFEVIGEINNLNRPQPDHDWLKLPSGQLIPVYRRGGWKWPWECTIGYTPVGSGQYLAVQTTWFLCLKGFCARQPAGHNQSV